MALCQCGCGRETPIAIRNNQYAKKGQPRRFYPDHRDSRTEANRAYRKTNRKELSRKRREWRIDTKLQALIHYGGSPPRCACCGESHIEFLTFDHPDGGGAALRKKLGRGMVGLKLASHLKRLGYPPGIRILCWNCNSARGAFGYCPHESTAPNRFMRAGQAIEVIKRKASAIVVDRPALPFKSPGKKIYKVAR